MNELFSVKKHFTLHENICVNCGYRLRNKSLEEQIKVRNKVNEFDKLRRTDRLVKRTQEERKEERKKERTNERKEERTNERKEERKEGRKKGRKEERKKECVFNHAFENELSYLKFVPFKCLLLGCCFLTETRTITYYNCVWTSSIFMIKSRIFIIQRKLDYRGCFTSEDVLLDQKMRVRTMKIVILQYSSTACLR